MRLQSIASHPYIFEDAKMVSIAIEIVSVVRYSSTVSIEQDAANRKRNELDRELDRNFYRLLPASPLFATENGEASYTMCWRANNSAN